MKDLLVHFDGDCLLHECECAVVRGEFEVLCV